jgi:hypothetical protein
MRLLALNWLVALPRPLVLALVRPLPKLLLLR